MVTAVQYSVYMGTSYMCIRVIKISVLQLLMKFMSVKNLQIAAL